MGAGGVVQQDAQVLESPVRHFYARLPPRCKATVDEILAKPGPVRTREDVQTLAAMILIATHVGE